MAKKRIAVLFGGASADYAASLRTAYSVLCGIPKDKYEALPIGITRAGRWLFYPGSYENIPSGEWEKDSDCCSCILSPDALHKGVIKIMADGQTTIHRVDGVFPVLHGKYGEDGRIQGLCKLSGLPLIGNDLAAANACLDKKLTNMLLTDAGIDVGEYITLDRSAINDLSTAIAKAESRLSYPMYAAPTNCSSSIGAYRAENREQLEEAIKTAFSHHPIIIVENEIKGRNIECAVLSTSTYNQRIAIGELIECDSKADQNTDYIARSYDFTVPARLDGITQSRIKDTARAAFKALSCKCFARVDLVLVGDRIYVRRVRGIPGLDRSNIFTRLVTDSAFTYEEMLDTIISSAVDAR